MRAREVTDAAWRDVYRGRVWRAQACRIVEDSEETIALWMPPGSPAMLPVDEHGARIRIPRDTWALEPTTASHDALCLARPGRRHSIYPHWQDGRFAYWYVNFEQPLRRTPVGFDTFDEKLDLIVRADGSYEWKDEDELEEAARLGIVNVEAVRAEAERVLADPPWPTGWEDWRPDPSWPIPQLPDGWDRV